jgi:hypothetical protein
MVISRGDDREIGDSNLTGRPKKRETKAQGIGRSVKAKKVPKDQAFEVFEFWRTTFGKNRAAVMDDMRRQYISAAIHDYGMEGAKQAIIGCSKSDFHMGNNKMNKKYNEITMIFRDADQTEKFIAIYERFNPTVEEEDPF